MTDNYVGLTIRTEVLRKDGVTVDIENLREIAVEAMKYYHIYSEFFADWTFTLFPRSIP